MQIGPVEMSQEMTLEMALETSRIRKEMKHLMKVMGKSRGGGGQHLQQPSSQSLVQLLQRVLRL